MHLNSCVTVIHLGLGASVELELLCCGLEAAMTHLGRGVNELELDLLSCQLACLGQQGAAQGENTLASTGNTTLDHQIIILELSIVGEPSHGVDALLGGVEVGCGAIVLGTRLAQLVDLLVHLPRDSKCTKCETPSHHLYAQSSGVSSASLHLHSIQQFQAMKQLQVQSSITARIYV